MRSRVISGNVWLCSWSRVSCMRSLLERCRAGGRRYEGLNEQRAEALRNSIAKFGKSERHGCLPIARRFAGGAEQTIPDRENVAEVGVHLVRMDRMMDAMPV